MDADEILLDVEERMEKAISVLKENLAGIRTGRASPGLVDSLRVEVYGSATPLKTIAAIAVPEPNQLLIRPYDPGTLKDIEKAILASGLGLTPQNDGRTIRLILPPLSTEVRRKMVHSIAFGSCRKRPRLLSGTSVGMAINPPTKPKRTKSSPKTNASGSRSRFRT